MNKKHFYPAVFSILYIIFVLPVWSKKKPENRWKNEIAIGAIFTKPKNSEILREKRQYVTLNYSRIFYFNRYRFVPGISFKNFSFYLHVDNEVSTKYLDIGGSVTFSYSPFHRKHITDSSITPDLELIIDTLVIADRFGVELGLSFTLKIKKFKLYSKNSGIENWILQREDIAFTMRHELGAELFKVQAGVVAEMYVIPYKSRSGHSIWVGDYMSNFYVGYSEIPVGRLRISPAIYCSIREFKDIGCNVDMLF
jgi:hypothetical protein